MNFIIAVAKNEIYVKEDIMAVGSQMDIFRDILKEVRESPETQEMAEEFQLLYGTLGEDDLKMVFSI